MQALRTCSRSRSLKALAGRQGPSLLLHTKLSWRPNSNAPAGESALQNDWPVSFDYPSCVAQLTEEGQVQLRRLHGPAVSCKSGLQHGIRLTCVDVNAASPRSGLMATQARLRTSGRL